MTAELVGAETCAGCHSPLRGDRAFCHFYQDGRSLAFCRPRCAEDFLVAARPLPPEAGECDVMERLVADWRWKEAGR